MGSHRAAAGQHTAKGVKIGSLVLFFEAQAWRPASGSIFEYFRFENRPQRSQPGKLQTPLSGRAHPALASITLISSPLARQGGAWRISSGPAGPGSPVSWRKASTTFWPTWPSRASMSAQRGGVRFAGGVRPAARIAPGTHRAAPPGPSAIWAEDFALTGPCADACKPVFRRAESC